MLAEASVRLNPVDSNGRLYDHLGVHAPVRFREQRGVKHAERLLDPDLRHLNDVRARNEAGWVLAVERTICARRDVATVACLCYGERVIEELTCLRDGIGYEEDLKMASVKAGSAHNENIRTLANQLVFHRPGVPQGQAGLPPPSRHSSFVKSRENHQSMATDIAERSGVLFTHSEAFDDPP